MLIYYLVLCLHVIGACVWVGGHLVLATRVLPRALREKKAAIIQEFEHGYEQIGMPALGVQILTGLWLAHRFFVDAPGGWFGSTGPARVIQLKLVFLAA